MKIKNHILFLLILLVAVGIRLYQFGSIPNGVNRDEASLGYTASLLIQTGQDEHGQKWPLKFESFGDWKQPLYIYLSIPVVWIFGLSPITVRLTSLISSMLMIVAVYYLTQKVVASYTPRKRRLTGSLAALLLTVNPWHFHFSHLALEAMVAATLVSFAILCINADNQKIRTVGIILLLLSIFTYHAAIIVIPLWLMGLFCVNKKIRQQKLFTLTSLLFVIVVFVLSMQSLFSGEKAKVTGTTIFSMSAEEQWQSIYQYRSQDVISKIYHNQYVYFGKTILTNYIQAFSPEFLFRRGGSHPHYNVPGFGNFFVVEIILCVVGIVWVLKTKNKFGLLFVIMMILAPLPGAITRDGVHSTRDIFMLPSVQILAASGCMWILTSLKQPKRYLPIIVIISVSLLYQAIPFYQFYWTIYPAISDDRFTGYMKDISYYLAVHQHEYQTIYITYPFESPYIFYAFYNQMAGKDFHDSIQYYPIDRLGFVYAKKLLNMSYIENTKDLYSLDSKSLTNTLVISRINEIKNLVPITTWKDKNGQPQIVAVKGEQLLSKPSK